MEGLDLEERGDESPRFGRFGIGRSSSDEDGVESKGSEGTVLEGALRFRDCWSDDDKSAGDGLAGCLAVERVTRGDIKTCWE